MGLKLYGSVNAGNTTLSNNISGGTLTFSDSGGVTLTGNLSDMALVNQSTGSTTLSGSSMSLTSLTQESGTLTVAAGKKLLLTGNSSIAGGTFTVNGTLEISGGTTTIAAGRSMTVETLIMDTAGSIILKEGAVFHRGNVITITGSSELGKVSVTADDTTYSVNNERIILENVGIAVNSTSDRDVHNKLQNSSLTNTNTGTLKVTNGENTITTLTADKGNVKVSESMSIQSIAAKSEKVVTVANGKTVTMAGGVKLSTNGADATLTAQSDNALAQLQEDASFTIRDMTLTNTTVTTAAPTTEVNFSNVTVNGSFVLNVAAATTMTEPTVGSGGAEGTAGTITYSYDLGLSSATAANNTITLNLDVLNAIAPSQSGQYTLVVELTNFDDSVFGSVDEGTWKSLVGFQEGSWLAEAITVPTVAPDGSSTTPTVSYGYTTGGDGSNVGRLTITISGLNVPEPATSTLSLLALAALAARRRRK